MRDDFLQAVKDTLARRVSFLCSNPSCPLGTIGPHSDQSKSINKGVAAHITAASPGGKRYDDLLASDERSSVTNGIWLCQNCAKLIDSDELLYTAELLRAWKLTTEARVQQSVQSNSPLLITDTNTNDVRVRASYSGGPDCSHIHFNIFNAGSKPVYLSSWFINCDDKHGNVSLSCLEGTLPFRLQDQDHYEINVDVGKDKLRNVKSLGIVDGNNRWWNVGENEVARIRQEYIRYKSLKPEPDTTQLLEELRECKVHVAASVKELHPNVKQLQVSFRNDSSSPIQLRGARIEWQYHPHRMLSNGTSNPKVAQSGGSVGLDALFDARSPVMPGETVNFSIKRDFAPMLVEVLFDDVKDEDIRISIYTNTQLSWVANMDEIPEAIREYAKFVSEHYL